MAGFTSLADMQTAEQMARNWHARKEDSESSDDWGAMWTGSPATTPGTAFSNWASSIVTFPDLSGRRKFLVHASGMQITGTNAWHFRFLDLLVGVSGVALNSTGDKTIASASLPRYTDGKDVQVYLKVTTNGTTTAPIVSLNSYTDQDGNTGQSGGSFTFPTTTVDVDTVLGPLPLAAGDSGVRAVSTLNVSTAAGGSCAVDLLLARTITEIGYPSGRQQVSEKDMPIPFMPLQRIYDGASIVAVAQGGAGAETFLGSFVVALDPP